MITGIGCFDASALRRLPPIADGLPYATEASFLTGFVIPESSLAPSPSNIRTIAHSARENPAGLRTIESP
jgi:hypothetical protein